jgi:predicted SAM-dependent methyltransferase
MPDNLDQTISSKAISASPTHQLNGEQQAFFREHGFLVLAPNILLGDHEISEIANLSSGYFAAWNDGFVDTSSNDSRTDPRFRNLYVGTNNVTFSGIPLIHMCTRGMGSVVKEEDRNWLSGKSGSMNEVHWDERLTRFVEDERILAYAKTLLGASELSFHGGLLSATYPDFLGEARSFHADTLDFVADRKIGHFCSMNRRFVLSFLIYLDDVSPELSPIKLIPKSHAQYQDINSHLATSYKQPDNITHYTQSGFLYEELLPSFAEEPVLVCGKKGTVICMQSSVLRAVTANTSKDCMRRILVLNYSDRDHAEFRKADHCGDLGQNKRFTQQFSDQKLVAKSFVQMPQTIATESNPIDSIRAGAKAGLQDLKKTAFHIYCTFRNYQKKLSALPTDQKPYLNLGASPPWRHPRVVCLDYDPARAEVSFDLNQPKALPFANDRFLGVYTSHCLEHLKQSAVDHICKEVWRVLKPGGVFRITVPDIKAYLETYDARDVSYFQWIHGKFPFRYDSWLRLIVRGFAEPVVDFYSDDKLVELYSSKSHEEFLNFFTDQVDKSTDERYFLPTAHKSWHSAEKFITNLTHIGFSSVREVGRFESECEVFRDRRTFNNTRPHLSFYVEAIK